MRKLSGLMTVALATGLLLAAVGVASATVQAAPRVVRVAAVPSKLKYDKKTLRARPGKIKLVFTNHSKLHHNVRIESGENELGGTKTIGKGTTTVYVTLKKGTYNFYCSVPGHEDAGMKGKLIVG